MSCRKPASRCVTIMDTNHRERGGALAIMIALGISVLAFGALAYNGVSALKKLQVASSSATAPPANGALMGHDVITGGEWVLPSETDGVVVLFNIGRDGDAGSMAFWQKVAMLVRMAEPSIQFVGLCSIGRSCDLQPGEKLFLAVLSSMDLLQMHAMSKAARQNRAFVYRGESSTSATPLTVALNEQNLAEEIINIYRQSRATGGA